MHEVMWKKLPKDKAKDKKARDADAAARLAPDMRIA
jgi:hypothetical protein